MSVGRGTLKWGIATFLAVIVLETLIVGVLGVTYALHRLPAIEPAGYNEFRPSVIEEGGTVDLCRHMIFHRSLDVRIDRAFIRQDGTEYRVELPSSTIQREAQVLRQCRSITLPPKVTHGKWVLEVDVRWTDWPFWSGHLRMPNVPLTVLPRS